MPFYVQRNEEGKVTGLYAEPQEDVTELISPEELTLHHLNESRRESLKRIDSAAEAVRLKFITPGAGQAMVYQRKVQEAETLALDNNPDADHYPLLAAEIGITGETLQEVAETVLAKRDQWLAVAALIERTRLLAKADIQAADTAAGIDTIISGLVWPQP